MEHGRRMTVFDADSHIYNIIIDIKAAPLWDAERGSFVGMLTATDFVNILIHYYKLGLPHSELAKHSIASWRGN